MKQPKLLKILSFVQMWEFFSYYGMRSLFVLFMIKSMQFSDSRAYEVNALFVGLAALFGILGGILADRYLGLRLAVLLGGLFLGVGFFSLLLPISLYLSLGLIMMGTCLYKSNIAALLGQAYTPDDPRREKGYTIFYMVQNLGAMVSTILCPVIANLYGFPIGFGMAASGMIIGNATLLWHYKQLPKQEEKKPIKALLPLLGIFGAGLFALTNTGAVLPVLPWLIGAVFIYFFWKLRKKVQNLFLYLGGLILFFAAQDQICSSLIVFAERETSRTVFGWSVPGAILMAINPLIILIFGAIIAKRRHKMITPFLIGALSFGAIAAICFFNVGVSIFSVMGLVALFSVAELMVGPVVNSYASKVAGKENPGTVMGLLPLGFSLAFLLGGQFSKMVAVDGGGASLPIYALGFAKMALILLGGGVVLQLLKRWRERSKIPSYSTSRR